jgi:hypothetical protein
MRFRKLSPEERARLAAKEQRELQVQQKDSFELLLELMLRFDLLFELKYTSTSVDGVSGDGDDMNITNNDQRQFLVPAMLETDISSGCSSVLHHEQEVMPLLYCYFTFAEEGAHGGLLPGVIFTRLQAKCACWAQSTSNTEPRLSRYRAEVTFGAQRFELQLLQEECAIMVVMHVYSQPGSIISLLQRTMLDEILAENFPLLTYETNVRDNRSGKYVYSSLPAVLTYVLLISPFSLI